MFGIYSLNTEAQAYSRKSLRIRLDSNEIVFRRTHREDQPPLLQGDVVFYTKEPTIIKDVMIKFHGVRRVGWMTDAVTPQWVHQKEAVFTQEKHLQIRKADQGQRVAPGTYSWPFVFPLTANMPETVDRLAESSIRYFLQAEVSTGMFARNIVACQELKIIKSPSFWSEEDMDLYPRTNEDLWPHRIYYQVTLKNTYQSVDKDLGLDFRLIPLKDDLKIGTVNIHLVQTTRLVVIKDGQPWRHNTSSSKVASAVVRICDKDCKIRLCDEQGAAAENYHLEDEAISFSASLPLPAHPFTCAQTIEDERIKVKYTLQVTVDLHHGDGHTSQVVSAFSPRLFVPIQPSTPLRHGSLRQALAVDPELDECGCLSSPPRYGEHIFDAQYTSEDAIDIPSYETAVCC